MPNSFVGPAVEKISRGSRSWPSIRWEIELSMPFFLRGKLHSQLEWSKGSVLPFHLRLGVCGVSRWRCFYFREDQVNFRGFMRTLAHFRPIEDNEKNKNPTSEPLNSRTNKLLCEWGSGGGLHVGWVSSCFVLGVCTELFYLSSSRFPSVWPGQRWQNLTGWTAAGECPLGIDAAFVWNVIQTHVLLSALCVIYH